MELQCVYGIAATQNSILKKHFPSAKVLHHSGTLLNALQQESLLTQETTVIVNIHDHFFDVIVSKNKSVFLFNTYKFKTKEDYLYFLLNTYEQLKLDTTQTSITILGRVEKNSPLIEATNKYIGEIKFGKRISKFKYGYQLSELQDHFFFNLFSQYLCV